MARVALVYLNTPTDFTAWHLALRRMVKGYNMGDALMFSVPKDRIKSFEQRMDKKQAKEDEFILYIILSIILYINYFIFNACMH